MIRFSHLARDDRGASIIELALVAPILASDADRHGRPQPRLFAQAEARAGGAARDREDQQYQATTSTYDTLQTEAAPRAAGVT